MMSRFDVYKDSGIEWIGEIPEHWGVKKLKFIADIQGSNVDKHIFKDEIQVRLCNYTDVYKNDFIQSTIEFTNGSCTKEEYYRFEILENDVIITKDSETPDDIGVPALVTEKIHNLVCGYHLSLIRTNPEIMLGAYLFRHLQTKFVRNYFEVHSNGITRFGLGKSAIESLIVFMPSRQEQLQIVEFLNGNTSLIDKLISVKQRKIELLKEKRTALINHFVTKGLDPGVKMKESGVEWIGEIPEHWVVIALKHIVATKITDGPHVTPEFIEEGIPFLSVESVQENMLNFDKMRGYISEEKHLEYSVKSKPQINDILFVKSGSTTGKSAMVLTDEEFSIWSPLCIIRSDENKATAKFVFCAIQSFYFRRLVEVGWSFGTQPNIGMGVIENLVIVVPPISEQSQIVEFLDEKTKEIDNLLTLEQKKIDLLKEYRQSLISEVVTGKIKVTKD